MEVFCNINYFHVVSLYTFTCIKCSIFSKCLTVRIPWRLICRDGGTSFCKGTECWICRKFVYVLALGNMQSADRVAYIQIPSDQ